MSRVVRIPARLASVIGSTLLVLASTAEVALAQASIDVGVPSNALTTTAATATFPVTLTRTDTTPALGFSVVFTVSPNLALPSGTSSITLGEFLSATGGSPTMQVRDLGGGQYAADGVTLGMPCGSSATAGTLFTITVSSTDPGGTGSITLDSVTLRDCSNASLAAVTGTNGSVTIDNTAPTVALLSPNGAEVWVAGSSHAITWSASDPEGLEASPIDLEWSSNAGGSWSPVALGLVSSGSFDWTVPATLTHAALVRVTARDANANSATDPSDAVFTILGATSTSVTSAANPSVIGESVTLTATVTPAAATGSVEFFDGASSLGVSPLSAGTATLGTAALTLGAHSITAIYVGDSDYSSSSSSAHTHTVNQAGTSTSVTSLPNPSAYTQSVTLTASVSVNAPGAGSPTGTVEFFDAATSLGTSPLVAGSAELALSTLAAGSHSIIAAYLGDANFSASTSASHTHVVNASGTSVSLVATPDPGVYLTPETLTATVTPAAATGSVEFFDGSTSLGTAPLSSGTAALITSALAVGPHSLRADYLGDGNHAPSSSSLVALEVKAKIVATSGANGNIAPSGTVLVSLNDTPSFTFAADPGYHVSSVTVDALPAPLTSPYMFAPVSANHTIDVQFEINPPVPPITTLASTTVRTGSGSSGRMRIQVDWSPVPVGSSVQVYRAPYGNYPEYDSGASPGSLPAAPGWPPGAPWTLTTVSAPGGMDLPPSWDFYYYVAFVTDGFGTRSPVSNMTEGSLAYALGDVSNGFVAGQGDNLVSLADVSLLGSVYGRVLTAGDAYAYLDVGPTTDFSVNARPLTDQRVNFEDLVMFGINYGQVSAPGSRATPAAAGRDELQLEAPASVAAGADVHARVLLTGSGLVHGMSVQLTWDPTVVEPANHELGELLAARPAVAFSPGAGTVDVMVLGGNVAGITGEGAVARVTFRVLRAGDPAIAIRSVDARDGANHRVAVGFTNLATPPRGLVTGLRPAMPTPFRDRTTLTFTLSARSAVELALYSVDGRRVRELASGEREPGEYRLEWDGRDDAGQQVAAGIYYARFMTPHARFSRKLAIIR